MRRIAALAVAAVAVAAVITPAQADTDLVTVYEISGKVTDEAGRPLSGVEVSDGTREALTETDGTYRIGQALPGPKSLTFERPDLVTRTKTATVVLPTDAGARVDAKMRYRIEATATPTILNVGAAKADLRVDVTSWAPDDVTSCVNVLDTATGRQFRPARQNPGVIPATLSGLVSIPKGQADGEYEVWAWASHCPSGSTIAGHAIVPFVVDSTKPVIGDVALRTDGDDRYVVVDTHDEGPAGIDAVTLTVTDSETGATSTMSATYDAKSGEAISDDPFEVPEGHQFTVVVKVVDRAANEAGKTLIGES